MVERRVLGRLGELSRRSSVYWCGGDAEEMEVENDRYTLTDTRYDMLRCSPNIHVMQNFTTD